MPRTSPLTLRGSEIIVLSPCVPRRSAPSNSLRLVTPLFESKTSNRVAIISPLGFLPAGDSGRINSRLFSLSRQLFPSGEAFIEERSTLLSSHAHPSPPPWRRQLTKGPLPRHITFDFDLSKGAEFWDHYNVLSDIFPCTTTVTFDGRFLTFVLLALPDRPWPKRIAGVPCYLTTELGDGPGAPLDRAIFSHIHISREVDCRNDETKAELVFDVAKTQFTRIAINITEIQYWGNFIVIVLERRDAQNSILPQSIARCNCFYLYEDEMIRPSTSSAPRLIETTIGASDNSQYGILRPGVMLSSGRPSTEGLEEVTSSGVLIQDNNGRQYLTAVWYGLSDGDKVFHPNSSGREVGQIAMKIKHADVSLVQLNDQSVFVNQPFQNTIAPGPPVQLQRFATRAEIERGQGNPIYMNNPFTGHIEGTQGIQSTFRLPIGDCNEPKQGWVATRWDYIGQGSSSELVDGIRGSAIWDDNGNVLGFFRYAPRFGHYLDWCMSISSSEFIDRGYSIV